MKTLLCNKWANKSHNLTLTSKTSTSMLFLSVPFKNFFSSLLCHPCKSAHFLTNFGVTFTFCMHHNRQCSARQVSTAWTTRLRPNCLIRIHVADQLLTSCASHEWPLLLHSTTDLLRTTVSLPPCVNCALTVQQTAVSSSPLYPSYNHPFSSTHFTYSPCSTFI